MRAYLCSYPATAMTELRNVRPETCFGPEAYLFLSPCEQTIGSICIAESKRGLGFVKVLRESEATPVATRFLLGSVDVPQLNKCVEWYGNQQALRRRIAARVKELDQERRLAMLAKSDDKLAELLAELQQSEAPCALMGTAKTIEVKAAQAPEDIQTPPNAE